MELLNVVIVILCLLLCTAYLVIYWSYLYWKNRGVHSLKTFLFFGNAKNLFIMKESFTDLYTNFYYKMKAANKPEGGFYYLLTPHYVPVHPQIIKSILVKDFGSFTDRGVYYNEKDDPLSATIFTLEGRNWHALRTKVSPTFTSGKIKTMFPIVVKISDDVVQQLKSRSVNKPVELKDLMGRYTTDIIGTCAFGIDCNAVSDPDTAIMQHAKLIFELNWSSKIIDFLTFIWPNFMRLCRVRQIPRKPANFFMKLIKETIACREQNIESRQDFMKLLLQLKRDGRLDDDGDNETNDAEGNIGVPINAEAANDDEAANDAESDNNAEAASNAETVLTLTDKQIAAQCFLFFVAGFETSSSTMSFCLYELACNEDIQDRLRKEILMVLKKKQYKRKLTYQAIQEMKYMDMVISETLRKYPSLPVLNRICTRPYRIRATNVLLDKGTQVVIPVEALHFDPEYFPNPEIFDPERFNEVNRNNIPPYAYLPFGEGPRSCVGKRFGLVQVKVILAKLLQEFQFKLNPRTKIPIDIDKDKFLKTILGGVWLNITNVPKGIAAADGR